MGMGEQGDLAAGLYGSIDNLLCSGSDVLNRLSFWDGRVPNGPVRTLLADLCRGASFEDAVIPFTQVLIDLRDIGIACDAASFPGALQRAGQYQAELTMVQIVPDLFRSLLSTRGERDVGSAGMGAGETPFRLPMTDQPQLQIQAVFLSSRIGRLLEAALQSKVFKRNGVLPDAIEGVDVMHFELKERALRHDHLRIRLRHALILLQVKLVCVPGAGQQSGPVALGLVFGGKVVLHQNLCLLPQG